MLTALPETLARPEQALTLHIALGAALQVVKGFAAPEVEQVYAQARTLCQQVGETPELVPVLLGLWRFYHSRSQLHIAREFGERLLRLAQRADDPALAVIAHYAVGVTWSRSRCCLPRECRDDALVAGVSGASPGTRHDALALAHALAHPYSLAFAQCLATYVYLFRRDVSAAHEQAEVCVSLSTAQGFPFWAALGTSLRGWALTMQGQGEEGIAQVRQGIASFRATGAMLAGPFLCALLAEVCDYLGRTADGLQALTEAHTLVEQHEERYWEAEVYRRRGVLLLRQPERPAEAETWLQRALDVGPPPGSEVVGAAGRHEPGTLWQQQGKRTEAHVLAPIYGWFTRALTPPTCRRRRRCWRSWNLRGPRQPW